MDIKLKVKLSAYSNLSLPNYLTDAPSDDKLYGRRDGEWVEIDSIQGTSIVVDDTSGLSLEDIDEHKKLLKIKQYIGIEPETYEDDTTYYIIDLTPNLFINGGTAFSDGYEELSIDSQYIDYIDGGKANTADYDLELLPLNAKGVLNG